VYFHFQYLSTITEEYWTTNRDGPRIFQAENGGRKKWGGGWRRGGERGGGFCKPNKGGLTFIACVDDGDSAYP
jgi:hypothetical protein